MSTGPLNAYPLRYDGGLFLICVGVAIALAALINLDQGNLFLGAGAALGILAFVAAGRRAFVKFCRPRFYQVTVLAFAIVLESATFYVLGNNAAFKSLPPDVSQLAVLAIVGVHFIIMRWALGPWMLRLGAANLFWAGIAGLAGVPIVMALVIDGILKLIFGVVMATPLFTGPAAAKD